MRLSSSPSEFWAKVKPLLRPRDAIRRLLLRSGAAVDARGLGVPPDLLRRAFLLCKDMRARYTVLDLASDLGVLEELADRALEGIVWEP
ncbi:MAG TPA: hypothetical protein EYP65_02390 [Armatimonadetes bacterium]|nr:hypothetical protein [Armatimonadota bacterium]